MSYGPNRYENPYQRPFHDNNSLYHTGGDAAYWPPQEIEKASRYHPYGPPNGIGRVPIKDYGRKPFVFDINEATIQNDTYRTAIWTGDHLQVTLMSINVGDDIGLEMHPNVDQFLRVEQGQGLVRMGENKNDLSFEANVYDDFAILIPAGTWHNVINTGNVPLKLYSIYGPPNHPFGTVHRTKADASEEEGHGSPGNGNTVAFGKTPDEWVRYTEYLVNEGLEDVKKGINATHILQEFILMGVLVGKGYSPEEAYETVEEWERTGESKLLKESKNKVR
ncbi:cupin domain-containing protein [Bacillus sp. NTK071]|uniref:cupin domain-containing protein n=1 Tax=Bacillus sp. NTK071 TaxID=2802175 RepID=UPI001A909B31|nr:cupin domain-containing protein [Bacillus sp. NTK071]MBN8208967.1 cupin domain-containing protein [Bacillus sp. NTK071]